ncbi:MAG: hypothetical protein QY314_04080 [Candidatus Dojkabacteria bacterium]|nr:MAG: hypothetical protein QY314_04080 [Candidatus Dojkabacteria bacterium]
MDEQQIRHKIVRTCGDISINLGQINLYAGPQSVWDGLGKVFVRKYQGLTVKIEIIELFGGGQIILRARTEDGGTASAYLIVYSYHDLNTPIVSVVDNQTISLEEVAEILNSLLEVVPPPSTPKQD